MLLNIPNLITLVRILLIPIMAVFLYLLNRPHYAPHDFVFSWVAGGVFIVAAVTDLVDGYLARKWGQVSLAGKFFDPLADKLLHMVAMVLLIPLGRIEAWVVAFLLFREIFITGLRTLAIGEGIVIAADTWGKWKTIWLNVAIASLIVHYPIFPNTVFELNTRAFGLACLWIGVFCAFVSGAQYCLRFWRQVRQKGHLS